MEDASNHKYGTCVRGNTAGVVAAVDVDVDVVDIVLVFCVPVLELQPQATVLT